MYYFYLISLLCILFISSWNVYIQSATLFVLGRRDQKSRIKSNLKLAFIVSVIVSFILKIDFFYIVFFNRGKMETNQNSVFLLRTRRALWVIFNLFFVYCLYKFFCFRWNTKFWRLFRPRFI